MNRQVRDRWTGMRLTERTRKLIPETWWGTNDGVSYRVYTRLNQFVKWKKERPDYDTTRYDTASCIYMRSKAADLSQLNLEPKIKAVKIRKWNWKQKQICSQQKVRSRVRRVSSEGEKESMRWEGFVNRVGFKQGTANQQWKKWQVQEIKSESEIEKPARGCRSETGSWFQRPGEVYRTAICTSLESDYQRRWGLSEWRERRRRDYNTIYKVFLRFQLQRNID